MCVGAKVHRIQQCIRPPSTTLSFGMYHLMHPSLRLVISPVGPPQNFMVVALDLIRCTACDDTSEGFRNFGAQQMRHVIISAIVRSDVQLESEVSPHRTSGLSLSNLKFCPPSPGQIWAKLRRPNGTFSTPTC